jgi:hypothetical protein
LRNQEEQAAPTVNLGQKYFFCSLSRNFLRKKKPPTLEAKYERKACYKVRTRDSGMHAHTRALYDSLSIPHLQHFVTASFWGIKGPIITILIYDPLFNNTILVP